MRKMTIIGAALMAGAAMMAGISKPAKAQVMVDMSLITCKQYLEFDPAKESIVTSWMGGYFMASKNLTTIDFRYSKRNFKVVTKYCKSHKDETLMNAVQKNYR